MKFEIHKDFIILSFTAFEVSSDEKRSHEKLLKAYLKEFSSMSNIHYAISRICHDLKNQLLAFQVCINSPSENTTSRLKSRYNASLHLDNAKKLCESAKAISESLSQPTITDVEINQLIREIVSKNILTLPTGIRISPPKTNEYCSIKTSRIFLESIFENIIKNSIEAFAKEGEIFIDWIYEEESKQVLIEIEDNGPGIDSDRLRHILSGSNFVSTKRDGSGIGMLTVKAMLNRIGGSITGESILGKGCKWSITLNDFIEEMPNNMPILDESGNLFEAEVYSKENVN